MKTVTSSIALAALVALGACVLPCLSNQHPYEELNEYLVKNVLYGKLKHHTNKVDELILSMGTTFTDRDEIFRQLAIHFSFLDDETDEKLCGIENLSRLRALLETGLNYRNTCPDSHINGQRLNELLSDLKRKVRKNCYKFVKRELEWWQKRPVLSRINTHKLLETINDEVWKDKLLLKDLIYCPEEDEESRNIKEHRISTLICTSIHHCLRRHKSCSLKKPNEFIAYMQKDLIKHCNSLLSSEVLKRTAAPLREILAVDSMDFLGDKKRSRYEIYIYMIKFMPVYLVCEWIKSKGPIELRSLAENVHELLMKDGEGSSRS